MNAAAEIDAIGEAARLLERAGIDNPRREARLLLDLARGDPARFADYVRRRASREPYSRISGRREFWSLDLTLSPATLDPRPDSETLIEAALDHLPYREAALRAIDFGTGSGALLLAFLSEFPHATGIGIDIQPGAVETARQNAEALGLAARANFIPGDWAEKNLGAADVILANPPYIQSSAFPSLQPEVVRFDPRAALDGGADGLAAYRALAPVFRRSLKPGGAAFLEMGEGQARPIAAIMAETGLTVAGTRRDLARIERCLVLRLEG
ncbi:MAG: peptide chain release factor N(5)-glutamine methyltransferase [Stellaceae bacterium]|jgi:release factor glutamine methyltransferase